MNMLKKLIIQIKQKAVDIELPDGKIVLLSDLFNKKKTGLLDGKVVIEKKRLQELFWLYGISKERQKELLGVELEKKEQP